MVKNDAGVIYAVACGWRTGRVYLYRSTDEGGTFEELEVRSRSGAEEPRLQLVSDTLRLLYKDNSASPFAGLTLTSSADAANWISEKVVDSLPGVGDFDFQVGTATDVVYERRANPRHVVARRRLDSSREPGVGGLLLLPALAGRFPGRLGRAGRQQHGCRGGRFAPVRAEPGRPRHEDGLDYCRIPGRLDGRRRARGRVPDCQERISQLPFANHRL